MRLLDKVVELGATVDLDRLVEVRAHAEHEIGVERRLGPAAAHDHPAGAVTEDVGVRARHRRHHAVGHRLLGHAQLRVHARDHDVELGEEVVVLVERAVLEDVDLDAGEDAERCELGVERVHDVELLAQPVG